MAPPLGKSVDWRRDWRPHAAVGLACFSDQRLCDGLRGTDIGTERRNHPRRGGRGPVGSALRRPSRPAKVCFSGCSRLFPILGALSHSVPGTVPFCWLSVIRELPIRFLTTWLAAVEQSPAGRDVGARWIAPARLTNRGPDPVHKLLPRAISGSRLQSDAVAEQRLSLKIRRARYIDGRKNVPALSNYRANSRFTLAYAWNPRSKPWEKRGALLASIDITDLLY